MSRRYVWLAVAIVALAAALTAWGERLSRRPAPIASSDSTRVPAEDVDLMIGPDGGMTPASVTVEKGSRVHLSMSNTGPTPVRVELPGYEVHFPAVTIEPGGRWSGEFVADRPGDDFAWLVDGRPAGRLAVTGSHLIEGHR
jgi:hypothetical protein